MSSSQGAAEVDPERIKLGVVKVICRGLADGIPLERLVRAYAPLVNGGIGLGPVGNTRPAKEERAKMRERKRVRTEAMIRQIAKDYTAEIAVYRAGGVPESFWSKESALVCDVPKTNAYKKKGVI